MKNRVPSAIGPALYEASSHGDSQIPSPHTGSTHTACKGRLELSSAFAFPHASASKAPVAQGCLARAASSHELAFMFTHVHDSTAAYAHTLISATSQMRLPT